MEQIFPTHISKWRNQPISYQDITDFKLSLLAATQAALEFPQEIPVSKRNEWLTHLEKRAKKIIQDSLESSSVDHNHLRTVKTRVIEALNEIFERKNIESKNWQSATVYQTLAASSWDIITPIERAASAGIGPEHTREMLKADPRATLLPEGSQDYLFSMLGGNGYKASLTAAYLLENFSDIEEAFQRYGQALSSYLESSLASFNSQKESPDIINVTNLPISQLTNYERWLAVCKACHSPKEFPQNDSEQNSFLQGQMDRVFTSDSLPLPDDPTVREAMNEALEDAINNLRDALHSAFQRRCENSVSGFLEADDIWQRYPSFVEDALWRSLVKNPLESLPINASNPQPENVQLFSAKTLTQPALPLAEATEVTKIEPSGGVQVSLDNRLPELFYVDYDQYQELQVYFRNQPFLNRGTDKHDIVRELIRTGGVSEITEIGRTLNLDENQITEQVKKINTDFKNLTQSQEILIATKKPKIRLCKDLRENKYPVST